MGLGRSRGKLVGESPDVYKPPVLEIRLLGPLEVRDGDRVLDVRRRKQRCPRSRFEPVTRSRRIVSLTSCGESAPRTARHALENYVSELRKSLGREIIGTGPGGYALEIDRDQVDVARFERLVSEARGDGRPSGRSSATHSGCSEGPRSPTSLSSRSPTPPSDASKLELAAREDLVEAELELGRHADVIVELEPLVAAHRYRERPRAQLMLALYRSGRQAEALAAYQDARGILVDELGIDPGEAAGARTCHSATGSLASGSRSCRRARSCRRRAPRPTRKTVTILRTELANTTTLAGALDPEPLRAVLDRYNNAARVAVERHGGICSRIGGETVLAVFGVGRARTTLSGRFAPHTSSATGSAY